MSLTRLVREKYKALNNCSYGKLGLEYGEGPNIEISTLISKQRDAEIRAEGKPFK